VWRQFEKLWFIKLGPNSNRAHGFTRMDRVTGLHVPSNARTVSDARLLPVLLEVCVSGVLVGVDASESLSSSGESRAPIVGKKSSKGVGILLHQSYGVDIIEFYIEHSNVERKACVHISRLGI
jgi:hypothetical protein